MAPTKHYLLSSRPTHGDDVVTRPGEPAFTTFIVSSVSESDAEVGDSWLAVGTQHVPYCCRRRRVLDDTARSVYRMSSLT